MVMSLVAALPAKHPARRRTKDLGPDITGHLTRFNGFLPRLRGTRPADDGDANGTDDQVRGVFRVRRLSRR